MSEDSVSYFLKIEAQLDSNSKLERQARSYIESVQRGLPTLKIRAELDTTGFDQAIRNLGSGGGGGTSRMSPRSGEEAASQFLEQAYRDAAGSTGGGGGGGSSGGGGKLKRSTHILEGYQKWRASQRKEMESANRANIGWARQESDDDEAGASAVERAKWDQARDSNRAATREGDQQRRWESDQIKKRLQAEAEMLKDAGKAGEQLRGAAKLWHDIGTGHIRGGVATFVTEAMGGGSAASGLGAMAGGVASSIALPIAWAIGNAMMALPGRMLAENESRARASAGGANPNLADQALRSRVTYWASQSAAGGDEVRRSIQFLQEPGVGMSDAEQVKMLDRLMVIGEGTAGGMNLAEQYKQLKQSSTPETRSAMLKNDYIRQQLKLMYASKLAGAGGDKMIEDTIVRGLAAQGTIGTRDIEEAIRQLQDNPQLQRRLRASTGSLMGAGRGMGSESIQTVSDPEKMVRAVAGGTMGAVLEYNMMIWRGIAPYLGFGGPSGSGGAVGETGFNPDKVKTQATWTSFSGLAEQMQSMWEGVPVIDLTSATRELTTEIKAMRAAVESSRGLGETMGDFWGGAGIGAGF